MLVHKYVTCTIATSLSTRQSFYTLDSVDKYVSNGRLNEMRLFVRSHFDPLLYIFDGNLPDDPPSDYSKRACVASTTLKLGGSDETVIWLFVSLFQTIEQPFDLYSTLCILNYWFVER